MEDARPNSSPDLILQCAGDGIFEIDRHGFILYVNPAGARMVGRSVQDLLGRRIHDVIRHSRPDGSPCPPEDSPLTATIRIGVVHRVTSDGLRRQDGTSFAASYTCAPICTDDQIVGAVLTCQDITERRLAEKKLEHEVAQRRQHEEELQLAKEQAENTLAELAHVHTQLLHADKMASIGQLAAGVAHEINNPVGFISSNINTLERYLGEFRSVLDADRELIAACLEQRADVLAQARAAVRLREEVQLDEILADIGDLIAESLEGTGRVRQIVSDLRDFSHVDSPDLNVEDIELLLDRAINVAWNELKYKADVVREYGKVDPIPCYGGKLGQVFLNLLVNAAHAIDSHGTITVRTGCRDGFVWVDVQDTGCGIPPEHLDRVFDPFFTTKEVGQGTGMGLHLSYRIVAAHGGRIGASSRVGVGSTFRVELPVAGPPDIAREGDTSAAALTASPPGPGAPPCPTSTASSCVVSNATAVPGN